MTFDIITVININFWTDFFSFSFSFRLYLLFVTLWFLIYRFLLFSSCIRLRKCPIFLAAIAAFITNLRLCGVKLGQIFRHWCSNFRQTPRNSGRMALIQAFRTTAPGFSTEHAFSAFPFLALQRLLLVQVFLNEELCHHILLLLFLL